MSTEVEPNGTPVFIGVISCPLDPSHRVTFSARVDRITESIVVAIDEHLRGNCYTIVSLIEEAYREPSEGELDVRTDGPETSPFRPPPMEE